MPSPADATAVALVPVYVTVVVSSPTAMPDAESRTTFVLVTGAGTLACARGTPAPNARNANTPIARR